MLSYYFIRFYHYFNGEYNITSYFKLFNKNDAYLLNVSSITELTKSKRTKTKKALSIVKANFTPERSDNYSCFVELIFVISCTY